MLKARSAALVLSAVLLAAGCGWSQYRAGPEGTGFNALESTLTRDNVAQLAPAWSRPVGWIEPSRGFPYAGVDGLSPLARSGSDLAVASLGGSVVLDATTGALRVPIQHSFSVPNDDQSVAIGDGRVVLSGGGTGSTQREGLHPRPRDRCRGGGRWRLRVPPVGSGHLRRSPVLREPELRGDTRDVRELRRSCRTRSTKQPGGAHRPAASPTSRRRSRAAASTSCSGSRNIPRRLAALDATTGAVRWGTPITPPCPLTAPTVSGGRVYTSGETFDAATGAKLWSWPTCAASSVVTVTPSTLYMPYRSAAGASRLQAVDARTGAAQWSIPWNVNLFDLPSIPAAANGLLFAAGGNKLIARDASNGAVLWRSPAITGTFSDPIVSDGMVFAMADDGAVHAYALP